MFERVVGAAIHEEGMLATFRRIAAVGSDEFPARILILTVAFMPFFAFGEVGRVLGYERLTAMFLTRTGKRAAVTGPS